MFTVKIDVEVKRAPLSESGQTSYNLYIDNQSQKELAVKCGGEIENGLYRSFLGAEFRAGAYRDIIANVKVELRGTAFIDKLGSKVKQEQEVEYLCGCCPPSQERNLHEIRNVYVTVLVTNILALFKIAQIGVNFTPAGKNELTQNSDLSICLHTTDTPSAVVLYPFPITHQQVVSEMQRDIDKGKRNPYVLFQEPKPASPPEHSSKTSCVIL